MKFYSKRVLKEKINKREQIIKILKIILMPILLFVLILNIYIIFNKIHNPNGIIEIFGKKNFVIISGSMEPNLKVGDVIIVGDNSNISNGDIITFYDYKDNIVTHRVIEIVHDEEGTKFRTKGDNNNAEDLNLVPNNKVIGKYSGKLSGLGKFLLNIKTATGIVILLLVIIIFEAFFSHRENILVKRHMKRTESDEGIYLKKYKMNDIKNKRNNEK